MHLFVGHQVKRRGRPLDRLLLRFLFISARQAAVHWHIICVWLWSYLWAYFVPNWKNKYCAWCWWQLCGTGKSACWEQFRKAAETGRWTRTQKNAQFLGSIFIQRRCCRQESLSFINVSLIMALCFRHQSLLWEEKKKSKRAVEWGREDLRMWWREWQRREKWDRGNRRD